MEVLMLLKLKTAVVYGAAGSVGAAVAQAFAREGAAVFLAGRRLARGKRWLARLKWPVAPLTPPSSTHTTRPP
jgi:NADP-dependent 3-hydroxy acid dehydrogenase YdfG